MPTLDGYSLSRLEQEITQICIFIEIHIYVTVINTYLLSKLIKHLFCVMKIHILG